ncbi:MAG: hypothetical protein BHW06_10115 [Clostridium sp. 44_14]|nr:MAG: hypothetical protein BHW06_10115 [Clostridium sp. 44_14]
MAENMFGRRENLCEWAKYRDFLFFIFSFVVLFIGLCVWYNGNTVAGSVFVDIGKCMQVVDFFDVRMIL